MADRGGVVAPVDRAAQLALVDLGLELGVAPTGPAQPGDLRAGLAARGRRLECLAPLERELAQVAELLGRRRRRERPVVWVGGQPRVDVRARRRDDAVKAVQAVLSRLLERVAILADAEDHRRVAVRRPFGDVEEERPVAKPPARARRQMGKVLAHGLLRVVGCGCEPALARRRAGGQGPPDRAAQRRQSRGP
jgi:hypothetical protein